MSSSGLLEDLIESLRCLPGVGPKSAQRIALHLLKRDRNAARRLGQTLVAAMDKINHCRQCRLFAETELCRWCEDPARLSSQLCIVENPADLIAIDRATDYRGKFFLLPGHLSPLDGVGPADLGLDLLEERLKDGGVDELTLATNPTVEGQATAQYICAIAQRYDVEVLQIARGVPIGSELEFADGQTLSVAFSQRVQLS
jgi:recombination protein RecR